MSTPSRYMPSWFLMIALATLAGCTDEGGLVGPEESQSFEESESSALARGRNRRPRGGPRVENFRRWDMTEWIARDHPLGRGEFEPDNVSHRNGKLLITIPAHSYNGGEIVSASRMRFRNAEIRLRTPRAPGTISTFFWYQLDLDNDEIDIEIFNDGSRQIWFTTWVAGVQTNHARHTLPFDPAARFHDYRIEWSPRRVRFLVDGVPMEKFTTGVPRKAMYLFSSAWWPSWHPTPAPPPQLNRDRRHRIDRIIY